MKKRSASRFLSESESEIVSALERWKSSQSKKFAKMSIKEHQARKLAAKKVARENANAKREELIAFATSARSSTFYSCQEWKKLRFNALQKYGRQCVSCGGSPEDGVVLHVDHIRPRFTFPELAFDIRNLQILCSNCNHGKGLQKTRVIVKRRGKVVNHRARDILMDLLLGDD